MTLVPRRVGVAVVCLIAALAASLPARAGAVTTAQSGQSLPVILPLVADDAGLAQFVRAVSTPGSPRYGDFASLPWLARRFGARPWVAAAALRYLRAIGAREVALSPTRMYVQATLTVAEAERTFGTVLTPRRDARGARYLAPFAPGPEPALPRLPAPLRGVATGIVGLDTQTALTASSPPALSGAERRALAGHRARAADSSQPYSAYEPASGTSSGCSGALATNGFTPAQYLNAYGFAALQRAGLRGGGMRAALIEIDGFKASDIRAFANCFHLRVPRIRTFEVGFSHPLPAGGETTLDLELLSAAAPRLTSLDVYENQGDAAHVLRAFTAPLVAPGAKPEVVSASLGLCEPFLVDTMGLSGIAAVERDLQLAAASGITVLASAGDQGSSACVNTDGSIVPELAVSYPASSPYVTGVGGTNVELDAANQISQELVWNDTSLSAAAGGGGDSRLFKRPHYQDPVVRAGVRAVPDVAMLSDLAPGYAIYCTAPNDSDCTGWAAIGGTSAATPLLAGGLALVDQALLAHHRKALGFLNPLLYRLGTSSRAAGVFRDVTAYGNDLGPWLPGGNGQPLGCCTAGVGFDTASGWGSVRLPGLESAALALQPPAPAVTLGLPGQQAVRSGRITAVLRCGQPCRVFVSGTVALSSSSGFGVRSRTVTLRRRGRVVLHLALSPTQLAQIRTALAHHHHVYAELFGVAVDRSGSPITVTPGAVLILG
jgi:subtilase family serine protease